MGFYRNSAPKRKSFVMKNYFPGLTYVEHSSLIHNIHPLVKLILLFSFNLTVFALPSLKGGAVLFWLLLLFYGFAGLGFTFFYRKLRLIFFFGLFIFLVQAFAVKEGVLLLCVSLGKVSLTVWSEGLWGGLNMMLRFVNLIGSSYLFVATTNPNRLAYALMQSGLPYRFGFMLITALRFIPIFHLELEQVKNAQMAKGIELEGLSPRKLLRAIKYLLVPLVISALSKVDFLTISMENRAFGLYPTRNYMYSQTLSRKDRIAIVAIPLFFLFFYLTFQSIG